MAVTRRCSLTARCRLSAPLPNDGDQSRMTKTILAGAAAFAIATGSVVSSTATASAAPSYNPTYCVLFLPFLCMPPASTPAPHKHHHMKKM